MKVVGIFPHPPDVLTGKRSKVVAKIPLSFLEDLMCKD